MYREYTVDKIDDSALDEIKRSYKTADETDESKNKVYLYIICIVYIYILCNMYSQIDYYM